MDSSLMQFLPFVFIFLIMYFLIIRPQQKQQKELDKMRKELKEGDSVVCAGGIHGKVVGFDTASTATTSESTNTSIVKVKVDANTVLRVDKSSVSSVKKEA